ncbi:MAG: hypothetical protein QXO70_05165 [Candidatus Pacearchaeota archaeon]
MNAKKLDEKKLKKEIEILYERFVKNPYDFNLKRRMWDLSAKYSAAGDLILNSSVARALNDLSFFAQKELPEGRDPLEEAKKILEELRKS